MRDQEALLGRMAFVTEPAKISRWGWMLAGCGPLLFAGLNIWTRLHDYPELAAAGRAWEAWTWELTSAFMTLALLPAVGAAALAFRGKRRALWHLPAGLVFAAIHISGFIVLRHAVYDLAGSRYVFGGLDSWLYELPKDLITYAITAGILTIACRKPPATPGGSSWLEVREGGLRHRLRSEDILAIEADGNYVRLYLDDGRRLFVRRTLKSLEVQSGLTRVHRGWLVNPERILRYAPGEGPERRVELSHGVTVPLSRQYAATLKAVLGRAAAPPN